MSKTKIKAELHLASKNAETGDIVYTFILTYPRIILPEVLTHRVFSRNTGSSRAIPTKKQRRRVMFDPFVPIHWGKNQKGMQAYEELKGWRRGLSELIWREAGFQLCFRHWLLEKLGNHKQNANRMIEPWTWTEQIVTTTDIDNWLKLRDHHAAEPHIRELSKQMKSIVSEVRDNFLDMQTNGLTRRRFTRFGIDKGADVHFNVQILQPGEWHLPFITDLEWLEQPEEDQKRISTARCAGVSYNRPDTGKIRDVEDCLRMCQDLAGQEPKHLSPFEHQAMALSKGQWTYNCGNLVGFVQYRKDVEAAA